jgi:small nuclear ribonucleoprotein (snRNP)-like protein
MEKPTLVNLERLLRSKVVVHVKDGRRLQGVLAQYDDYMNLLLKDVEEYLEEKLLNRHKLIMVKGGNIQAIST